MTWAGIGVRGFAAPLIIAACAGPIAPVAAQLCAPNELNSLRPTSWFSGANLGSGLAISGDTLVAGASGDNEGGENSGAVYVFERTGPVWSSASDTKLLASDAGPFHRFGGSVAISGDTIVVGAQFHNGNGTGSGAVYVFVRDGGTAGAWIEQAKLTPDDAAAQDGFGKSVGIAGDTIIIGAPNKDNGGPCQNCGAAYVFVRTEGAWAQQAKLTASDADLFEFFGSSVAISGGGDTALIGAPGDSPPDDLFQNIGSAYVFTRTGSVWSEQSKLTVPGGGAPGDRFGESVALHADTAAIGAPWRDGAWADAGAVYVFQRDSSRGSGDGWNHQATLTVSDTANTVQFGQALAISPSGETIIATKPRDNANGLNSGSAYLFVRSGENWLAAGKFTSCDGAANDLLGEAAALDADTAVFSAMNKPWQGFTNVGVAYVVDLSCEGACCVNEECAVMRPSQCAALGGVFLGMGTSCADIAGGCEPAEPNCPADLNDSGAVDVQDLLILLGAWGPCPK